MTFIAAILIVLVAGLFVGSRFEGAREAHQLFSSYRSRTIKGFGAWLTNTIMAALSVVGLILLLYLLLFRIHVH